MRLGDLATFVKSDHKVTKNDTILSTKKCPFSASAKTAKIVKLFYNICLQQISTFPEITLLLTTWNLLFGYQTCTQKVTKVCQKRTFRTLKTHIGLCSHSPNLRPIRSKAVKKVCQNAKKHEKSAKKCHFWTSFWAPLKRPAGFWKKCQIIKFILQNMPAKNKALSGTSQFWQNVKNT